MRRRTFHHLIQCRECAGRGNASIYVVPGKCLGLSPAQRCANARARALSSDSLSVNPGGRVPLVWSRFSYSTRERTRDLDTILCWQCLHFSFTFIPHKLTAAFRSHRRKNHSFPMKKVSEGAIAPSVFYVMNNLSPCTLER